VAALHYDLIVKTGRDYEDTIPVIGLTEGADLTGWSASGQIRDGYGPNATLLHTLTLIPTGTNIVLRIPHSVSSAWTWHLARYDVKLTAPDGTENDFLEGSVVARPAVTP
jgi:hypothetical protein